ncbi:nucleotidyltransferase family protein, partial [Microbacterium sp.]|uniref:nucleotidyltransferase family protein n=1 Tax=Microbacterium sp. TaxID=51671 RepID=UPI003C783ACC
MTLGVCGIVLAAGAGTRYGGPKALARDDDGIPWVVRAVTTLREAGCAPVIVCLGAARAQAASLVPAEATIVEVPEWAEGLSASVRAGLRAAAACDATAALVIPVDVPGLPASA